MITVAASMIGLYILAIGYNLVGLKPKACPICVAVAGTWLWQLVVYFVYPNIVSQLWLGILMGGSVIGIMYQIDKKLAGRLSWIVAKPIWVTTGFGLISALIRQQWSWVVLASIILMIIGLVVAVAMFSPESKPSPVLEKLKNCC